MAPPRKKKVTKETARKRAYDRRPDVKKKRAARNKARRKALREGRARKGDGTEVHHKDGNPMNNSESNTKIVKRTPHRRAAAKKQARKR